VVVFEASAQADDIISRVAEGIVKAERFLIRFANLKIDLGATRVAKS
jgi:hypothetical protein